MAIRLTVSKKLLGLINIGFSVNLQKLIENKKKKQVKKKKEVKNGES